MLADDFRKQVYMIPEAKLAKTLARNLPYTKIMPDDTHTGKASTDKMVEDFITLRKCVDCQGARL
jgi:hypothetical protein